MRSSVVAACGTAFSGSAFASPVYRIPALTVTTSGRIILAYDVRSDWRDLPAEFDIAVRTCDDGGRTWSDPRALRRHSRGHGFGDASLMTDPTTGRVFCWHVGSTGESYFSARADVPGLELWVSTSDDEGDTWSHDNVSFLRPAGVAGMFCASGNGAVLADGTLVQPFVARIGEQNWAICASSTDHGRTWRMGEPTGPDCDESKVVALRSSAGEAARALMHARATPRRRQALSCDAGMSFSSPHPVDELIDPACNGGLARVGQVLISSMCHDPVKRRRLSLHLSVDEGASWTAPILVDSGASAYSVLVACDDESAALAWEADDYHSIVFAVIRLDELGIRVGEDGEAFFDSTAVTLVAREGASGFAKPPLVNPQA